MKKLFLYYKILIYKSRYWLYFVVGLALVWSAFALVLSISFPGTYEGFANYLGSVFGDILGDIEPEQKFELSLALFKQNFLASFLDIALGAVLGLVPVITIAVNFFALGFLAAPSFVPSVFDFEAVPLGIFLVAILPHGVFEIPAIFLSAAFGMRLGWQWLFPSSAGRRLNVFKSAVVDSVKILPLVLVLLIIAAFVESYVTGWILGV